MRASCLFVIEKGKISISIDNARIVVTGTPLNDRLYDFVGKKTSLDDRAYELERQESRMIMDGKAPDEIQREITREREKLAAEMNALAKEFIQKNYDNVLGPGVFIMLCSNFPYPVMTPLIEEIIEEAPDRFKNNSLVKDYVTVARSNMEKLKLPINEEPFFICLGLDCLFFLDIFQVSLSQFPCKPLPWLL